MYITFIISYINTYKILQIFSIVHLMNLYHENRYLHMNLQNYYLSQSFDGSLLRKNSSKINYIAYISIET